LVHVLCKLFCTDVENIGIVILVGSRDTSDANHSRWERENHRYEPIYRFAAVAEQTDTQGPLGRQHLY
jgi:hypothetical protein